MKTRFLIATAFVLSLFLALARFGRQAAADGPSDLERYDRARRVMRDLIDRFPRALPENARVAESIAQLPLMPFGWPADAEDRARSAAQTAILRIVTALELSDVLVRLSPDRSVTVRRRWPAGTGVVVFRVDGAPDEAPDFVRKDVEGKPNAMVDIRVHDSGTTFAVLTFADLPSGLHRIPVTLRRAGGAFAPVVEVDVPPAARLNVVVTERKSGQPTPAVAAVYTREGHLMVPDSALSFDNAGFRYAEEGYRQRRGKARSYAQSHYWPFGAGQRKAFFVDGGFDIQIPEGEYTVVVGKGFEYTPVVRSVRVDAGSPRNERVQLERWIDMPAKGWYSGDGHVHFERSSPDANNRLLLWARAEDVHMINAMRMGDALETYFEQYAFGKAGRFLQDNYAIVPGQEDPRTTPMGHTLQMNLQSPVRRPDLYYHYDIVFDEIRRQGGLTGYAHVYQPAAMGFYVRQDMSLNVPAGRIDFAEISEFGEIDTKLYYEFLNLGFPLTASAGSDVPWGHSIGTSRVYAYTGGKFDPDTWFDAVKKGHTFVTTGPMLELTVNGRIPGSVIDARPGETLRIQARASGRMTPPRYLEIVTLGDVAASANPEGSDLAIEHTLKADRSLWIAARCAGAHTTPVYVKVGGEPFWNKDKVKSLVGNRLAQLDDIEKLIAKGVVPGRQGTWNGPESLQRSADGLRKRVATARATYRDLLQRAAVRQ